VSDGSQLLCHMFSSAFVLSCSQIGRLWGLSRLHIAKLNLDTLTKALVVICVPSEFPFIFTQISKVWDTLGKSAHSKQNFKKYIELKTLIWIPGLDLSHWYTHSNASKLNFFFFFQENVHGRQCQLSSQYLFPASSFDFAQGQHAQTSWVEQVLLWACL
jgi:hypothetical protein